MGEKIIAWFNPDGRLCLAEAFCPHLGASLWPDVGGGVIDGRLVCPFHGFEYDSTGQCVHTPYGDPPPTARLRVFQTQEFMGLIFAWWGIDGREPQWPMPEEPEKVEGWGSQEFRNMRFAGHPQETTENAVDFSHLNYVHGFGGVNRAAPLVIEGHRLESRFDFNTTIENSRSGIGHLQHLRNHARLRAGHLARRYPGTLRWDGHASVSICHAGRRHADRPVDCLPGQRDTKPEASFCRNGLPPEADARAAHEQVCHVPAGAGHQEGHRHFGVARSTDLSPASSGSTATSCPSEGTAASSTPLHRSLPLLATSKNGTL